MPAVTAVTAAKNVRFSVHYLSRLTVSFNSVRRDKEVAVGFWHGWHIRRHSLFLVTSALVTLSFLQVSRLSRPFQP